MKTILFVFSATGNTLNCARKLAALLPGEVQLLPFASLTQDIELPFNCDAAGFLFPVYYGDMPYLVRTILPNLKLPEKAYTFCLLTYRGHAGAAAQRCNALQAIDAHYGIPMPGNSWMGTPEEDAAALAAQDDNIRAAADRIIAREAVALPDTPLPDPSPIAKGYYNMRGMAAEDTCIGCGTCVKVCPMNNIRLQNGKAVIGDLCLTCLACFHWCPVKAIWMSKDDKVARRPQYQHPQVTVQDIMALNK